MIEALRTRMGAMNRRGQITPELITNALTAAAIEFLADHPVVPSDEEIQEFYPAATESVTFDFLRGFAVWWGRRMFTMEEPGVQVKIEAALMGTTLTPEQGKLIINLVKRCIRPRERG